MILTVSVGGGKTQAAEEAEEHAQTDHMHVWADG